MISLSTFVLLIVAVSIATQILVTKSKMRAALGYLTRALSQPGPDQPQEQSANVRDSGSEKTKSPAFHEGYDCQAEDVFEARRILSRRGRLPPELVDLIIEYAEYWVCSTASGDWRSTTDGAVLITGGLGQERENGFLLRTKPLGLTAWTSANEEAWAKQARPIPLITECSPDFLEKFIEGPPPAIEYSCRRVVFDIYSHDQGWGGPHTSRGSFKHSWTWFEAGLERFEQHNECTRQCSDHQADEPGSLGEPHLPTCAIRPIYPAIEADGSASHGSRYCVDLHPRPDHMIQCNKTATHETQHHHVEWRWDDEISPDSLEAKEILDDNGRGRATGNGEFVRNLKLGDIITVWGRARFPGWVNNVERVNIRVYWAI